eukprot:UN08094
MQKNGEGGLGMSGMGDMSGMMLNTYNFKQAPQQQQTFIQYQQAQPPPAQPRNSGNMNNANMNNVNMMNSPAMIRLANANQQNTMPTQIHTLAEQ